MNLRVNRKEGRDSKERERNEKKEIVKKTFLVYLRGKEREGRGREKIYSLKISLVLEPLEPRCKAQGESASFLNARRTFSLKLKNQF